MKSDQWVNVITISCAVNCERNSNRGKYRSGRRVLPVRTLPADSRRSPVTGRRWGASECEASQRRSDSWQPKAGSRRSPTMTVDAWPLLAALLVALRPAAAFYLPGLAPVNYCKSGDTSPTCKVFIFRYYVSFVQSYILVLTNRLLLILDKGIKWRHMFLLSTNILIINNRKLLFSIINLINYKSHINYYFNFNCFTYLSNEKRQCIFLFAKHYCLLIKNNNVNNIYVLIILVFFIMTKSNY